MREQPGDRGTEHLSAFPPHRLFVVKPPPAHPLAKFFSFVQSEPGRSGHGTAGQGSDGIAVLAVSLLVGALTAWVSGFCGVILQLLPKPRNSHHCGMGQEGGPKGSSGPLSVCMLVCAQAKGCLPWR